METGNKYIEKMYKIFEIINGIAMISKPFENVYYYSIGEAEHRLSEYYKKHSETKAAFTIQPTYYLRTELYDSQKEEHEERRARIAAQYPESRNIHLTIN